MRFFLLHVLALLSTSFISSSSFCMFENAQSAMQLIKTIQTYTDLCQKARRILSSDQHDAIYKYYYTNPEAGNSALTILMGHVVDIAYESCKQKPDFLDELKEILTQDAIKIREQTHERKKAQQLRAKIRKKSESDLYNQPPLNK